MGQGVIKGFDRASDGPIMVVRRPLWDEMSLDGQRRLSSSLNCAFAKSGFLPVLHVRDELAGSDLRRSQNRQGRQRRYRVAEVSWEKAPPVSPTASSAGKARHALST
jgi:hypothetical protein